MGHSEKGNKLGLKQQTGIFAQRWYWRSLARAGSPSLLTRRGLAGHGSTSVRVGPKSPGEILKISVTEITMRVLALVSLEFIQLCERRLDHALGQRYITQRLSELLAIR